MSTAQRGGNGSLVSGLGHKIFGMWVPFEPSTSTVAPYGWQGRDPLNRYSKFRALAVNFHVLQGASAILCQPVHAAHRVRNLRSDGRHPDAIQANKMG